MKSRIFIIFLIVNIIILIASHHVCFAKAADEENQTIKKPQQNTVSTSDMEKKVVTHLWGYPAPNALYLGMVTYHLQHSDHDERWNNNLMAMNYHGYFLGTLKNSFDDRAYAFGIERLWGKQPLPCNFSNEVGYRIGVISGYDERMMRIAKYTPLLPFPQVIDTIMWKNVGLQMGWSVVTVSAILTYHF